MPKLLMIINTPEFFLSHRLPIAQAAKQKGYDVHIATGPGNSSDKIKQAGFAHYTIPLSRSGTNPLKEFISLVAIAKLLIIIRPDIGHFVTIKPNIYGGLMARLFRVPSTVFAISGLGSVFSNNANKIQKRLVQNLYNIALNTRQRIVIFQNEQDRITLLKATNLEKKDTILIQGSGVDLDHFSYKNEPRGTPVVLMACRLLAEKGVFDFVEAARILAANNTQVIMRLVGETDPGNPSHISQKILDDWKTQGVVEILGRKNDMPEQIGDAHVVCFPSYYGEGVPKILLEAAASGRPIITSDMAGCRDAVLPGKTGIIVPPRSPQKLALAIETLIKDVRLRRKMGRDARILAEQKFSVENVVEKHLNIYSEL